MATDVETWTLKQSTWRPITLPLQVYYQLSVPLGALL